MRMSLGKWWSCRNNKKFYRKMEHDINQSLLRYILRVLLGFCYSTVKKWWERNSPNFAPPLILEKIRRNFKTKLRLLVLYKLIWNAMFLHRRKLRILIFWSAYALQYKYLRNVGLKERFEAIGAASLFLKDCACPLKAVYRLQCITTEGQEMLTSIFMAHLSDPLNQAEISRYIF